MLLKLSPVAESTLQEFSVALYLNFSMIKGLYMVCYTVSCIASFKDKTQYGVQA